MKRKDSNCVGILSDQGKAVTASNLSEYTILRELSFFTSEGWWKVGESGENNFIKRRDHKEIFLL